ncbi:hypothetical protein ACFRFL_34505 [Streptomyces sp. NPDC056708]|uniref:hypothetical protein n=1 Tax=unclassified Streptomyces TaxID=2593676 RepID=UPI0036A3B276
MRAAACATYYRRPSHPALPADLLPTLLADPVTRAGAVRHRTLDADTARRLADDPDEEVRKELAEHPDLPPQLRDVLADDPSPQVRLRIFARQDTPESTRAAIHAQILSDAPPPDWLADHQVLDDDALDRQLLNEMARVELRGCVCSGWPLTPCADTGHLPGIRPGPGPSRFPPWWRRRDLHDLRQLLPDLRLFTLRLRRETSGRAALRTLHARRPADRSPGRRHRPRPS